MIRTSAWLLASLSIAALSTTAEAQTAPKPPVAAKKPHEVKAPFGATRQDPYYWLRDDSRKNPEMLAYLAAENAYADALLAPTKPLQDKLYGEITGRIKQDDSSVPYRKKGYWYYSRFETGGDYPIVARRKGNMDAPEQILLDEPKMGAGKGYFAVGGKEVSPDDKLLAYAEDLVGRRQYVIRVKTIADGKLLADEIPNAEPDFAWADDSKTIFYVEKDPTTLLGKRVKAHVLGTPVGADRLVYEEKDDTFYMGLKKTTSDKFICIVLQSTVSNEERCAPSANPVSFTPLAPRERDFLYSSDNVGEQWTIRTNWQAPNYRLMTISDGDAAKGRAAWKDIVPTSASVFIENFQPFDSFLAIEERSEGNKRLRLLTRSGKSSFVNADEPAYAMALDVNAESGTPWVRYTYDSLRTPETTYEVNVDTGERKILKVQEVKGYDPTKYVTERVWATARDGTKVPVSLIYAKGFQKNGSAPLYQYAYGSYGYSTDPAFSPLLPSLLDRGVIFAQGHIRGIRSIGRWRHIQFNETPEITLQIDQLGDHGFVPLDPVYQQGQCARRAAAMQKGGAGQVQKSLVDGKRLHEGGGLLHHPSYAMSHLGIATHVGFDHHGLRACLQRLEHRHGRAHPVDAGDVAAGGDHATLAAADDNGFGGEFGAVAFFHAGIEGVAIHMRDGKAEQRVMGHHARAAAGGAARAGIKGGQAIAAQGGHDGQQGERSE
mgnify:CR=1 FL=1